MFLTILVFITPFIIKITAIVINNIFISNNIIRAEKRKNINKVKRDIIDQSCIRRNSMKPTFRCFHFRSITLLK